RRDRGHELAAPSGDEPFQLRERCDDPPPSRRLGRASEKLGRRGVARRTEHGSCELGARLPGGLAVAERAAQVTLAREESKDAEDLFLDLLEITRVLRAREDRVGGKLFDGVGDVALGRPPGEGDRKSTRLNSSHVKISYAVFCLKKKKENQQTTPDETCMR